MDIGNRTVEAQPRKLSRPVEPDPARIVVSALGCRMLANFNS